MMKCPKCQFENPEIVKLCVQCGNKLEIGFPNCGVLNAASIGAYLFSESLKPQVLKGGASPASLVRWGYGLQPTVPLPC